MATSPILPPRSTTLRRRQSRTKQTSLTLFPQAARHGNCESPNGASAPPPVPSRSEKPATELVGIARLAASSPRSEAKRGAEYFLLPVKSILNECHSERVPFRWTVNPYRGCEFGCKYCYARYTHEYMEIDASEFESKIYVKQNVGALAERDLAREPIWGEHIAIGTATDPYQPAEREFRTTRTILEKMAEREGLSLSITTKSNQVVRDVDLLRRISEHSALTIHITVTTLRARLARMLEPRAPRSDLRLEAVRKLRDAGIAVGVNVMPILPGLTDREADLDALFRAARDAGAQWIAANVVFLMPASWRSMLGFLDEKFPKLAEQYRQWFRGYGDAPESYRQQISERVERLRRKYELGSRPIKPEMARSWRSPQLELRLGDFGDGRKVMPTARPPRRKCVSGRPAGIQDDLSAAVRVEGKPMLGMKLKSVSNLTMLIALFCLAAFAAGRPPASAVPAATGIGQRFLPANQGTMIREDSLAAGAASGKWIRRKSRKARERGRPFVSCLAMRSKKTSS
jgi:DNA repair photolyase